MNRELEQLILLYERVSAARDKEAEEALATFEAGVDSGMGGAPDCFARFIAQECHPRPSAMGFETSHQAASDSAARVVEMLKIVNNFRGRGRPTMWQQQSKRPRP